MFSVGDPVVHCIHGAGTIMELRDNSLPDSDETSKYYVIDLVESSITLSVPVDGIEGRLRPASSSKEMRRILGILQSDPRPLEEDAKKRGQIIRELLQDGDASVAAQIICSLGAMKCRQGELNATDTGLLEKALSFLAGEVALVQKIELEEARYRLIETYQNN